jgi:hypothetical protein
VPATFRNPLVLTVHAFSCISNVSCQTNANAACPAADRCKKRERKKDVADIA